MTDGRRDADLEASTRARILDEYRRNAEWCRERGVTLGRPRGVLTEEAAAERRQLTEEATAAAASQATVVVPVVPPKRTDGEAAFRHARLAVTTALVLVLALVWLMQRRSRRGHLV